jgi:hypothetical protein
MAADAQLEAAQSEAVHVGAVVDEERKHYACISSFYRSPIVACRLAYLLMPASPSSLTQA